VTTKQSLCADARLQCLLKVAACAGVADVLPYQPARMLDRLVSVAAAMTDLLASGRCDALSFDELDAYLAHPAELPPAGAAHVMDGMAYVVYTHLCPDQPYSPKLLEATDVLLSVYSNLFFDEKERRRRLAAAAVGDVLGETSSLRFSTLRGFILSQAGNYRDGALYRMARTIYDGESFEVMPVLGDLLEEAGCPSSTALLHCRNDGPHVRGCWVLDHILGWR
jgi:hypothetical protein